MFLGVNIVMFLCEGFVGNVFFRVKLGFVFIR